MFAWSADSFFLAFVTIEPGGLECPEHYRPSSHQCEYGIQMITRPQYFCCPVCKFRGYVQTHPPNTVFNQHCYVINNNKALSCCPRVCRRGTFIGAYFYSNPGSSYTCTTLRNLPGYCCRHRCSRSSKIQFFLSEPGRRYRCVFVIGGYCCRPRPSPV